MLGGALLAALGAGDHVAALVRPPALTHPSIQEPAVPDHPGPDFRCHLDPPRLAARRPDRHRCPPSLPLLRPPARPARLRSAVLVLALIAAALTGAAGGAGRRPARRPPGPASRCRARPVPSSRARCRAGRGGRRRAAQRGVVEVRGARGSGTGSGFVLDDRGHVLTNAHVVGGGTRCRSPSPTGGAAAPRSSASTPAPTSRCCAYPAAAPPPLPLGVSADLRSGDAVLAVGSPLGMSGTVTSGIVSAVDPERRSRRGNHPDRRAHQPRQLRRPAARRGRARDRRQHRDRVAGLGQHRDRLRRTHRPRGGHGRAVAPGVRQLLQE